MRWTLLTSQRLSKFVTRFVLFMESSTTIQMRLGTSIRVIQTEVKSDFCVNLEYVGLITKIGASVLFVKLCLLAIVLLSVLYIMGCGVVAVCVVSLWSTQLQGVELCVVLWVVGCDVQFGDVGLWVWY